MTECLAQSIWMTASNLVLLFIVDFRQRAEFPPSQFFYRAMRPSLLCSDSELINYRKCVKYSREEHTAWSSGLQPLSSSHNLCGVCSLLLSGIGRQRWQEPSTSLYVFMTRRILIMPETQLEPAKACKTGHFRRLGYLDSCIQGLRFCARGSVFPIYIWL